MWITHRAVQDRLQCTERTLRNYCFLLEKNEYEFQRDPHGKRLFCETDISLLSEMLSLKAQGLTFDEAALKVITQYKEQTESKPEIQNENIHLDLDDLIGKVDELFADQLLPLAFYRDPEKTLETVRERWNAIKMTIQSEHNSNS